MKHIVVVETTTSGSGFHIFQAALEDDNIKLTFICENIDSYRTIDKEGILNRISIVECNTKSIEKLRESIKQLNSIHKIDGLVCLNDKAIEQVSVVAEEFNLSFMSATAVKIARNKDRFRDFCLANHFPVPNFIKINPNDLLAKEALIEKGKEIGYPLIIKTSLGTGSANVVLCKDEKELCHRYEQISGVMGNQLILLEEFITGPVFSVESITFRGETQILGLSDRTLGPQPNFVELGATFPVSVGEKMYAAIEELINRLFSKLGISHGVSHTEIILSRNGPVLVELNPRLGGGLIGPMISKSYGINIYKEIIKLALDVKPVIPEKPLQAAAFQILFSAQSGKIKNICANLAKDYPSIEEIIVRDRVGQHVQSPPTDFRGDLAIVLAVGETTDMAVNNCKAAMTAIHYEVEIGNDGNAN